MMMCGGTYDSSSSREVGCGRWVFNKISTAGGARLSLALCWCRALAMLTPRHRCWHFFVARATNFVNAALHFGDGGRDNMTVFRVPAILAKVAIALGIEAAGPTVL